MENALAYLGNIDSAGSFGAKLVSGTNLFGHVLPATAGNSVLVTPYSTQGPDNSRQAYYPCMQIKITHESPHAAYTLGCELLKKMQGASNVIPGAKCFAKNSQPLSLGVDDRGNTTYAVNFSFMAVF
jgi:hypothetical protein